MFEPDDYGIVLYTNIVDNSINSILAKNKSDLPIEIPYNYRLEAIIEYDFDNIFLTIADTKDQDITDLTARKPRKTHKSLWIRKIFTVLAGITTVF